LVSLLVVICSFLALFQLHCDETFGDWWRRKSLRSLKFVFGFLMVAGLLSFVVALVGAYSLSDLFRPEFGSKPITSKSYKGASAPWAAVPAGLTGDAKVAAELAGWKRLMNTAVANDPQNQKDAVRQLFYFESSPFNRNYRAFTAELEIPTTVEISECYAFLATEAAARSSHEGLESLQCSYPLGVDRNKAQAIVASPNAGERLVFFVVAQSRDHTKPFPKDIEASYTLRSIK
jgi:hypothetical protein